ncbi:MAG: 5'-nucleotidase [Firmicutes bacterium]|nr:5'-nucleotidase [Bacillota bacterium]
MAETLNDKLVVSISSRALFDLEESNRIYETQGLEAYICYQIEHENEVLRPGVAFPLIRRLLALQAADGSPAVEVVLVSKNDANTGLRVFNSIEHYQLNITRAAFTCNRSPYKYLEAFKTDLFLSADPDDVGLALGRGFAAANILTGLDFQDDETPEIRIAFDGDAVLFSDESEQIFQERGLDEFKRHEAENSHIPMAPGPFKGFLESLNRIQAAYKGQVEAPIRIALVTARNAPSHKRAITTLRHWGVHIDEAFFLGGLDKSPFLKYFRPHIFFDDQKGFCEPASKFVPTGHVPGGVKNQEQK